MQEFIDYTRSHHLHKVLDLGSGSGAYAKYFTTNGLTVKCIDTSEAMVDLCLCKDLDAQVMDFYDLKLDDNSFDVIWSLNTLLHVPKRSIRGVLQEIKRVMNTEGIFYLGIYGGESSEGIYEEDFYRPQRFFARYNDDELKSILEEYFEIVKFEHVDIGKDDFWFQSVYLR